MLNIHFEEISKEEQEQNKKNKMEEKVLWRYQTPLEDRTAHKQHLHKCTDFRKKNLTSLKPRILVAF